MKNRLAYLIFYLLVQIKFLIETNGQILNPEKPVYTTPSVRINFDKFDGQSFDSIKNNLKKIINQQISEAPYLTDLTDACFSQLNTFFEAFKKKEEWALTGFLKYNIYN
jgi:hypothetical protein